MPTSTLTERLGKVGLWVSGAAPSAAGGPAAFARRVEAMGIGGVWVGGGTANEEALRERGEMLAATERLVVATGIVNIWAWSPAALASSVAGMVREYPGRFVLGLGVSHRPLVEQLGRDYARPLAAMRHFLDDLDRQPGADTTPLRVLAALGPKMLELARDRAAGAHPYLVPPAHSAAARKVLGPGPLLAPEQAVVMQADPGEGRRIARQYLAGYLQLPNYLSNLRRFGFDDRDFGEGGSDRLVDALVPWGDAAATRVAEHFAAGADHVCVQPLADGRAVDWDGLAALVAH